MDTTKLDDLLNKAEAQEENQIEWLLDQKYDVKDFYVDEHGIVEIKNKTIGDMSKHISVKGESYSQYIEFKINRFYDGIDLTNMLLAIYYDVPNVGSDESKPINVYYNETEIKFGWAIPVEVAQTNLTIDLCVYARGKLSDGKDYVLKTKTATYQINDGLDLGGNILKPTNNWYLNFVLEMDEKIAQANASADIATQNANKVEEIERSISNAYEQVSTMHTEVESMRDEVERMKDQVEDLTGVGIASVDKLGVSKPDGVTIDIEEDGTLKCIVEVIKDYSSLENKPKINGTELDGDKTFEDLGFEGTTDYQVLENKPSIAGVELSGNKSYDELGIVSKKDVEDNFEIVNQNIQELDEYTQILGRDVSNFAGAIQETNLELQTLNERVDNLNQSATNNFSTIGQRLEELEGDLTDVSNTLSSADTKLKELETDLEETSNQLQEVYTTSEENKKEVADVRKELSDTTLKIDTVIEKADLRIKETASGESIHSTISANAKVVEFALYGNAKQETTTGAQLLNYDVWKTVDINRGTAVFENNGVTITATIDDAYTDYAPSDVPEDVKIPVVEGDVITFSWDGTDTKQASVYIFPNGLANNVVYINSIGAKSLTYTVPSDITFITFRFGVRNAGDTISYKNIMINKGSTPLPYEPYTGGKPSPNPNYRQDVEISGASGSVVAKSCGKNLLKTSRADVVDYEGVNIKLNEDKSITLNGIPTRTFGVDLVANFNEKGKFFINCFYTNKENNDIDLYVVDRASGVWYDIDRGNGVYLDNLNSKSYYIACHIYEGQEYNNLTIYPMIRACDENGNPIGDDTYEPYKETSSTIPTPNGLAGIDVDSSGNYTDENGKQWICDEIVKYADGSGEHVQRILKMDYNDFQGTAFIGEGCRLTSKKLYIVPRFSNVLCTHLPYSTKAPYHDPGDYVSTQEQLGKVDIRFAKFTNVDECLAHMRDNNYKIYAILKEPIRTPLTAEQIAEIEKLCTFYPATNIFNDADCGMKVTYIVDAKKYIDNKIAELATAMVNSI